MYHFTQGIGHSCITFFLEGPVHVVIYPFKMPTLAMIICIVSFYSILCWESFSKGFTIFLREGNHIGLLVQSIVSMSFPSCPATTEEVNRV